MHMHMLRWSWGSTALFFGVIVVMGSHAQMAKRALVKVLLVLAAKYLVTLSLNRDSTDAVVRAGYKRMLLKVHHDKGGDKTDAQMLQEARERLELCLNRFRLLF